MRLLIDADGCPVVDITVRTAKKFGLECIIICDSSHIFSSDYAQVITVDKGADSADLRLVNLAQRGDIAVTQDYGLAAMCLAKHVLALNQNGLVYDDSNIDSLLLSRHTAKKIRRSGGRLKGPPKRTSNQDKDFETALVKLITNNK
ncbi:YaiI/YqxD family protein [Ruminococcus sp.]|uniref:YaiI/YqxD family protein n=1 Tax=Ruminococcus sp. TaxID=41978 RepID=UPI0025F96CA7|nr:YaiI/YqxD family protein [Ruminococcus sp.]